MKKAVYYARVSTSLQEEKGTIESQKYELIKQIKNDGNILVKEYVDNGWSGGRLDRPALDELRGDLKSDLFDVVYFLDSDRIARDVTYQNIIISEILKYNKEIIIKGKNYIHNPENKFTLTVLGAVNELEKAKIVERLMRGRREKARKGAIVDGGGLFGYTYIKRTDSKDGYYLINENDAEVVKLIFQTYANTDKSITGLIKFLEKKNIKTSSGNAVWGRSSIRRILANTSYYGLHYFNKEERMESAGDGVRYAKNTKTITRIRDKAEWIPVTIPAIIDKEIFDVVQEKLKRNYKLLRSSGGKYLLSGLVKCGQCNHTYTGVYWSGKKFYRCNYREKARQHTAEIQNQMDKCTNKGVKGELLETLVLDIVEERIFQPSVIKKHIDILNSKKEEGKTSLKNDLEAINKQSAGIENKKLRTLDLYVDNGMSKEEYKRKIDELESQNISINSKKDELTKKLSLIENRKNIRRDINYFCKLAKKRFSALDLKGKGLFLQQIIEKIVYMGDKIQIIGNIPVLALNASNNNYSPIHCTQHSCHRPGGSLEKIQGG